MLVNKVYDDFYGLLASGSGIPKSEFPSSELNPRFVYQAVHDELVFDGNSRQNLATFCQTWVEPEVHTLMNECIDKNMVDKDEYPQTAEIESRCVRMLADLWHSPATGENAVGTSTTGSSEAAMLGGVAGLGLGSLFGRGTGHDVAGGAVAGHEVQKHYDKPVDGQQIIVRTTSGVLVSVTPPGSSGLSKGQRVYIEGRGEAAHVRPQ